MNKPTKPWDYSVVKQSFKIDSPIDATLVICYGIRISNESISLVQTALKPLYCRF